jgi:hypothetical protein
MCDGLMVADEEANEIGELLIWDSLYIQEEFSVASLDFWYRLNVDLAGPDGECLYLKIVVRGWRRTPSPPSPWFEHKGELLDREDPFVVVPPHSLCGHAI